MGLHRTGKKHRKKGICVKSGHLGSVKGWGTIRNQIWKEES